MGPLLGGQVMRECPTSDEDINKNNHVLPWMEKDLTHIFTFLQILMAAKSCGFWGRIIMVKARKYKGGICCRGHLAVTYGGELLYLQILLYLSPPSKYELPLLQAIKSCTHNDYSAVNHVVTMMCIDHAK